MRLFWTRDRAVEARASTEVEFAFLDSVARKTHLLESSASAAA
jgi:hypothetical protein